MKKKEFVRITQISEERAKEILSQVFISRSEFRELLGFDNEQSRKLFNYIKDNIKQELAAIGRYLPDSRHLPLKLACKYLEEMEIDFKNMKNIINEINVTNTKKTYKYYKIKLCQETESDLIDLIESKVSKNDFLKTLLIQELNKNK